MQIQILFDTYALDSSLSTGLGVSYLIDKKILFDTGEQPWLLFNNIDIMNVAIEDIEKVVISHDHWDHTGGLEDILEEKPDLKVYGCPGFSEDFKKGVKSSGSKMIEVKKLTKLSKNIYTTGEIEGVYKNKTIAEQAIVLKTEKGLVVITGCAHPGIISIVEWVIDPYSPS